MNKITICDLDIICEQCGSKHLNLDNYHYMCCDRLNYTISCCHCQFTRTYIDFISDIIKRPKKKCDKIKVRLAQNFEFSQDYRYNDNLSHIHENRTFHLC